MLKTFVSSFVLLLASSQLVFVPCQAQKRGGVASEDTVTTPVNSKDAPIRGVQYASAEEAAAALAAQKRLPLIAGKCEHRRVWYDNGSLYSLWTV